MRLAYLNTEYPALSHTFIEREVRALRVLGVDVQTFSVRRPGASGRMSDHHRRAAEQTTYLLDGRWGLLREGLGGLLLRPWRGLRTWAAALRYSPPGLAQRVRHLVYGLEAIRLARLLKRRGLSHVHVHMANNGAMVALLATVYDPAITYSLTVHGPAEFFNVEAGRLKLKAERATFVRCISQFCRSQVMTWTDPHVWPRLHVVPCGIEIGDDERPARTNGDTLRLLTVGRLAAVKGYPVLLRACRLLKDRNIAWRLTMIGEGPMRGELERLSQSLGIADRVEMVGAVGQDDIGRYYDAADVMVVSSFMEGVPVVLMEAMARRLAVVATNVGGVGELVEAGRNGWLMAAGDERALADALAEAAVNPQRRRRYGEAGRQDVSRRHDIRDVGRSMKRLFAGQLSPSNELEEKTAKLAVHAEAVTGEKPAGELIVDG